MSELNPLHHVEALDGGLGAWAQLTQHGLGAVLAIGAVVCWTWYPIRNAEWLRAHPDRSPRGWATAQGLVTLPLAAAGYGATWLWWSLAAGGALAIA